jgi:hypothetical protein
MYYYRPREWRRAMKRLANKAMNFVILALIHGAKVMVSSCLGRPALSAGNPFCFICAASSIWHFCLTFWPFDLPNAVSKRARY